MRLHSTWIAQFLLPHKQSTVTAGPAAKIRRLKKELTRVSENCDILMEGETIDRHWSEENGRTRTLLGMQSEVRVKVHPSDLMAKLLPDHVDIVATHPLFGPQSACDGIKGLKIAVCPIRGLQHWPLAAFLRKHLGLQVIITTPHDHDREAATVQGLTHLIAKVLQRMGPMPSRMTTRSFDLLVEAVSMVQNDAPEVFDAIEKANPYSADIRRKFFDLAHELSDEMENNA